MTDRPDQVGRPLEQLSAALPISARVTPELKALLREKNCIKVPATCNVTWVSHAGDEGGIDCQLDAGADTGAAFTSLTHQRFDPRLPRARNILTSQKHRLTRSRRQPQGKGNLLIRIPLPLHGTALFSETQSARKIRIPTGRISGVNTRSFHLD